MTWPLQSQDWVLPFTGLRDGDPIGLQALEGKGFAGRRAVDTHSWLGPAPFPVAVSGLRECLPLLGF